MENTKVTKKASAALKTIDPVEFVAAVFDPFVERLAVAIKETDGIEFDITTTAGMEVAKKCRATFREIRIGSDKERAERKAPLLLIGKMLEAKNTEIENEAKPHEDKFDAVIKAEEARKEEIKAAIMRELAAKEAAINSAIDAIKNKPIEAINLNSEKTQLILDELMNTPIDDEFYGVRLVEVELLIDQTVQTLTQMIDGKKAQEQIAAQAQQAQAEQNRIAEIKERINNIKTVLIEAMDVQNSSGFGKLINAVNAIEINEENFSEFLAEAQTAKDATLKGLSRQFDAMVFAENQAEESAKEMTKAQAQENKTEVDKAIQSAVTYGTGAVKVTAVDLFPQALEQEFGKQFVDGLDDVPTPNDIINTIANAYKVNHATARQYVINAYEFIAKKAA